MAVNPSLKSGTSSGSEMCLAETELPMLTRANSEENRSIDVVWTILQGTGNQCVFILAFAGGIQVEIYRFQRQFTR